MDASVDRRWLLGEPVAVQRRLVKAVGEYAEISLEFKHVEEILHFAAEEGEAGNRVIAGKPCLAGDASCRGPSSRGNRGSTDRYTA